MASYKPARGWRLDRIPGKRVTQTGDLGRGVTLPLWVVRDGEHQGDGQLRLSPVEAEQLHAELCYALGDAWTPGDAPPCRLGKGATAATRRP
ncbi:hypothetical protein [Streptomyces hygroscopicus]|uniref:hypothetical protein n=1 Tax=Streptomyces hygroscopicus TaxID=1912 RepID=UPI0037B96DEB